MQNSEMFIARPCRRTRSSRRLRLLAPGAAAVGRGLGDARAVGQAHLPLDDDPLAVLHARLDGGAVALDADQLDVAHLRRLVVLGDEHERTLLAALDGNGRDHHRLGPDIEIDLDIDIHARPQLELLVGERRLGGDGAGVDVDAAVDEIERAGRERRARSRRVDAHRRRRGSRGCLAQRGQIALGQREADADGLDLRDRHEAGRIVDADEIARRHADGADAAGDRRLELGVSELQPVGLQHRLVGLDRLLGRLVGGGRLVELLLRRDLLCRSALACAPGRPRPARALHCPWRAAPRRGRSAP